MRNLVRAVSAGVAALAVAGATLLAAPPAWAAASVSVSGPDGAATASSDHATEVTVSGSGFQAIQNGFGGVYVLFGWVADPQGSSWKPSNGGTVGADYRYVPDAESAENAGFQKFLAFPGSQTESSAHGVLGADGSWSVGMVIPGATFESHDRDGNVTTVDCLRTTCGIITIGAHGVKNANNETFTPLTFRTGEHVAAPVDDPADGAVAAPAGEVRVGVESANVRAGTSIVFTGQGFTPGEQVVASLDEGLTAVGPLTAGAQGEVAAALPVPRDIRNGTHLVTLRGAGSGAVAEAEVTVTDGLPASATGNQAETPAWALVLMLACIVLALVLVVTSVVVAIVRARARRRGRGARPQAARADSPATGRADAAQTASTDAVPPAPANLAGPDDLTAAIPPVGEDRVGARR